MTTRVPTSAAPAVDFGTPGPSQLTDRLIADSRVSIDSTPSAGGVMHSCMTGSLRIQKTCRSDFSSSASTESGKLSGNQGCSAVESVLKLVDLSRIGQIPVSCTCTVLKSTN